METKKWKGPCCVAWNCSNRQKKRSTGDSSARILDITFHRFSTNFELRGQWVTAIKRQGFIPSRTSRICSEHFKESDFTASRHRRRLKEFTVPSIFSFPEHLQPKRKPPRRILTRHPAKDRQLSRGKKVHSDFVAHDHSYSYTQRKVDCLKSKMKNLKNRLKNTRARLRRRSTKNKRLQEIINQLRDKNLIESEAEALLQESFSGMSYDLFRHIKCNVKGKPFYLPKVKNFALSLHFLSPKAYEFVRPILHLPHPRCLRRWKASVHCSPGYLDNMLNVASKKARETNSNLCSLVVDEMSLRRDVSWVSSQNRYCGFTDFGNGPVGNSVATNAMLFMLVSLKGRWKVPIAYFLTDHISSSQLATCVREAILKAADYNLIVKTLVADGLRTNMKAATELGCDINVDSLRTHFTHPHPKHAHDKVYFICDPPHMLKLFRNFLAERGVIKRQTENGLQTISWQYIKSLHDIQSTDSLYLANKLTNRHINFNNVKMKVSIAAQTLSSSVATAIDHLRDDLRLQQFQGSEETCHFIRQLDRLFDTLNSKNPFSKGSKAALSERNIGLWKPFLQNVQSYLISLLEPSGVPIFKGRRNQCVLGFVITAQSALDLATDLLSRREYSYVLTYKFSQDHVEMFFSKIRQRNGWNNNPTSEQFKAALKSLMISSSINPSKHGNTIPLDDTMELSLTPDSETHSKEPSEHNFRDDVEFLAAMSQLHSPLMDDVDWRQSCIFYTAGFVAKQSERLLKCHRCSEALFDSAISSSQGAFLHRKNRGSLRIPSPGVLHIVSSSEKAFRIIMPSPESMDILPSQRYIDLHMQTMVVSSLQMKHSSLFPSLVEHFYEHEIGIETDHITRLIKTVASVYIKMRLLKAGKLFHQRKILMGKTSKRTRLNKIVLFSGQ